MTYIPDTRQPIIKLPFSKKEELNHYYEGLLDARGIAILKSYDYAAEDLASTLDNWVDVLAIAGQQILEKDSEGKYTIPFDETIDSQELEVLLKPNVQRYIKFAILNWMDMNRNEMAVALIEGMDDEEHQQLYSNMEKDYNNISVEEFNNKYPITDYYITKYDYDEE